MQASKLPSFPKTIIVFSIIFLFTQNSSAQNYRATARGSFKLYSDDIKTPLSSRPRIVKIESAKESSKIDSSKPVAEKMAISLALEQQIFDLINRKRSETGLPPLVWNEDVARVARIHSENMANYKFFSHKGLEGKMVNDRADDLGVKKWQAIGENIAYNRGFSNPLEFAVEGWMKSQAHRENILNNRWKESGIGIAVTADGTYYFTEVFLLRK